MVHLLPGDPAIAIVGPEVTPDQIRQVREEYHLDDPWLVQYLIWMKMILRGDFGVSIVENVPISKLLLARLPVTLQLTGFAMIISLLISIPAGVVSAVKKDTLSDNIARVFAFAGICIPNFWLGIMLILIFGVLFPILPVYGYVSPIHNFPEALRHLLLPSITLGTALAALVTRMTRSCLLEVLACDYVTVARAKGLPEHVVIYKHALRNAMIPVITVVGLQFGFLLGGSVLVETVFALPGIGKLVVDSIFFRDYPVVQGVVLCYALVFSLVNLLVDVLYGFLDPRIRY